MCMLIKKVVAHSAVTSLLVLSKANTMTRSCKQYEMQTQKQPKCYDFLLSTTD